MKRVKYFSSSLVKALCLIVLIQCSCLVALSDEHVQERDLQSQQGCEIKEEPGQWLTYLGDNQRSGVSAGTLSFPLERRWHIQTAHAPSPAWPAPAKMDYFHDVKLEPRVTFDRAYHLVGKDDLLFYGSSSDDKITCLNNQTGEEVWSAFTEGPVRLAPSIYGDLLITGSDDGYIYCHDTKSGALQWKLRGSPEERRLPGNERLISLWPIRTGVLIEDHIAHYCAGFFPNQGVYRGAIDLKTGEVIEQGVVKDSPQGYLRRDDEGRIVITQGRSPKTSFLSGIKKNAGKSQATTFKMRKEFRWASIRVGDVHLGGGIGRLVAIDSQNNEIIWESNVRGTVYSLAIIGNKLYASTDTGDIYCFGDQAKSIPPKTIVKRVPKAPPKASAALPLKNIFKHVSPLKKGYALVRDLSFEQILSLACESEFHIAVVETDLKKVDALRRSLAQQGLYGSRVVVHHLGEQVPYVDGIFNLILDPLERFETNSLQKLLQPFQGIALSGQTFQQLLRGQKPKNAGSWNNMYANASNTNCSEERHLSSTLRLQWFGEPGPRNMVDRHHRTVAPLSHGGKLIIPGENIIMCSDAWNGALLWEKSIPQSMRIVAQTDSSYISIDDDSLFVAAAEKCLVLDIETGKTVRQLKVSSPNTEWGYLGLTPSMVIGSEAIKGSIRRNQNRQNTVSITHRGYVPFITSSALFGKAKDNSEFGWIYRAKGGIVQTSICLYEDQLFFIESHNEKTLHGEQTLKDLLSGGSSIICLNSNTGELLWKQDHDISTLRHNVSISAHRGVLVCSGSKSINEHTPGVYVHKGKNGRLRYQLLTVDVSTGEKLWEVEMDPKLPGSTNHGEADRRPILIQDKLFLEPYCYELKTGKPVTSYGMSSYGYTANRRRRRACGQMTASNDAFFFRNASASRYDLETHTTSLVTKVTRPGCWINMIPASGLLLIPEASSGCKCDYAIQTSMAFRSPDRGL